MKIRMTFDVSTEDRAAIAHLLGREDRKPVSREEVIQWTKAKIDDILEPARIEVFLIETEPENLRPSRRRKRL